MPFILRPSLPTDAPILTQIYLDAFSADDISLTCFPRTPATTSWWETNLTTELTDPNAHFVTILDTDTSTVVAFAKWYATPRKPDTEANIDTDINTDINAEQKPESESKTNPSYQPPPTSIPPIPFPPSNDPAFATFFFTSLDTYRQKIMTSKPFWYLELIATRKEHQGKGCAGKLIRYGLEKADEEGVECYLEASPEGAPIYEYFGFREVDRLVVFGGKFVELFMVRQRRGKVM